MEEMKMFNTIKKAYMETTHSDNSFESVVNSIIWDSKFIEDNEMYFSKGGFLLVVGNLNPFSESCKPHIIFEDGSETSL